MEPKLPILALQEVLEKVLTCRVLLIRTSNHQTHLVTNMAELIPRSSRPKPVPSVTRILAYDVEMAQWVYLPLRHIVSFVAIDPRQAPMVYRPAE